MSSQAHGDHFEKKKKKKKGPMIDPTLNTILQLLPSIVAKATKTLKNSNLQYAVHL